MSSGSSIASAAEKLGFIAVEGSWKIIWISLRYCLSCRDDKCEISVSPSQISPPSGLSRRVTQRAIVDLPDPELPTSASVFPAPISKSTPSTATTGVLLRQGAFRLAYCFRSPHTRKIGLLEFGVPVVILETRNVMTRIWHQLPRIPNSAVLHSFSTTRLETTSHSHSCQIRQFPRNHRKTYPRTTRRRILRQRQQCPRIRVQRFSRYTFKRPFFYDPPRIHHHHAIRKTGKQRGIMTDD